MSSHEPFQSPDEPESIELTPLSPSIASLPGDATGAAPNETGAPAPAAVPRRRPFRRLRRGFLAPMFAVALAAGIASSGLTYVFAASTIGHDSATVGTASGAANAVLTSSTTASGSAVAAYARAKASVVTIAVTQSSGRFGQTVSGVGTGIIVGSNGIILTNKHVVAGATSVQVTLPDGQTVAGSVYGTSSTTDLATVKVDASGLTAATLSSAAPQVGETVFAIGDPLGEFADSLTAGVVSGLDRSITVENENRTGLIQTDAAVNGGNSGGPLVDANGDVVGIVTAGSSSAQGIAFAIPIGAATSMIAAALGGQSIG